MTTLIVAFLRGSLIVTLRAAFAFARPTLISTDLMPEASLAATTRVTFLPRLSAPLSLTDAFGLSVSAVPPTGPPPPDGEPPPLGDLAPGSPPAGEPPPPPPGAGVAAAVVNVRTGEQSSMPVPAGLSKHAAQ